MMATYQQYNHPTFASGMSHNNHHGGRSRRAPRVSVSQNSQKSFRGVRSMKELTEPFALSNFRQRFESIRSFDLEDDMEFCPALLTESDLVSIHSSSSERSSLASNSPTGSPKEMAQQPTTSFALNSASNSFVPLPFMSQQSNIKLHQPAATRMRNAIPIINPATGITMASPPPSVSPGARLQQGNIGRRW